MNNWWDLTTKTNDKKKKGKKNTLETLQQAVKEGSGLQKQEKIADKLAKLEREDQQKVQKYFERAKKLGETEIYNRSQRETQQAIAELQREVLLLAKKTKNLKKELEGAAVQPIVEPNQSDLTFLQNLKRIIITFGKKIEEASLWLREWNRKTAKKGMYWNKSLNDKKGGTGYMLSSEHYVTRSVG